MEAITSLDDELENIKLFYFYFYFENVPGFAIVVNWTIYYQCHVEKMVEPWKFEQEIEYWVEIVQIEEERAKCVNQFQEKVRGQVFHYNHRNSWL